MPGLIVWKDQEIDRLRRDMDRLLSRLWDDFCVPFLPRALWGIPSFDQLETEDHLVLRAELPGIAPEDLEVTVTDDNLTIKGEVKQELMGGVEDYEKSERKYGLFSRTIQLPCKVLLEDIKATYKDEILTIIIPKCKAEPSRGIKIKVT